MKVPDNVLQRHGFTTQGEWKTLKRKQFKAIQKAFGEYRIGCVYTPSYYDGDIQQLYDLLERINESMSIKEWGR